MRIATTSTGYRFDKLLFWGCFFLIALVYFALLSFNGTGYRPYVNCFSSQCENPFINFTPPKFLYVYSPPFVCNEAWCNATLLSRGEYGTKPPRIELYFFLIMTGVFIIGFVLNHALYNVGKKFRLPIADVLEKVELDETDSTGKK